MNTLTSHPKNKIKRRRKVDKTSGTAVSAGRNKRKTFIPSELPQCRRGQSASRNRRRASDFRRTARRGRRPCAPAGEASHSRLRRRRPRCNSSRSAHPPSLHWLWGRKKGRKRVSRKPTWGGVFLRAGVGDGGLSSDDLLASRFSSSLKRHDERESCTVMGEVTSEGIHRRPDCLLIIWADEPPQLINMRSTRVGGNAQAFSMRRTGTPCFISR